jgi:hypothetical protein
VVVASVVAGQVVALTGPGDDDVVAVAPIALVEAGLAALGRPDTEIQAPPWGPDPTVREVMSSLTSSALAGRIVRLSGHGDGAAAVVAPMSVVDAGRARLGRAADADGV